MSNWRENEVARMLYFEGKSRREIAEALDLSVDRVRQINHFFRSRRWPKQKNGTVEWFYHFERFGGNA